MNHSYINMVKIIGGRNIPVLRQSVIFNKNYNNICINIIQHIVVNLVLETIRLTLQHKGGGMVYFFTLKKKKKTMYSSYCSKNKLNLPVLDIFLGFWLKINKKIQGVKAPIYCEPKRKD